MNHDSELENTHGTVQLPAGRAGPWARRVSESGAAVMAHGRPAAGGRPAPAEVPRRSGRPGPRHRTYPRLRHRATAAHSGHGNGPTVVKSESEYTVIHTGGKLSSSSMTFRKGRYSASRSRVRVEDRVTRRRLPRSIGLRTCQKGVQNLKYRYPRS